MNRILLSLILIGSFYTAKANVGLTDNPVKEDIRLEVVSDHVFFILKVGKNLVEYGDKVELVFGLNYKIELYNISGNGIHTFTNPDELVLIIASEDLRCFNKKKLRKIKVFTEDKTLIIKTNIGPNHLKIK